MPRPSNGVTPNNLATTVSSSPVTGFAELSLVVSEFVAHVLWLFLLPPDFQTRSTFRRQLTISYELRDRIITEGRELPRVYTDRIEMFQAKTASFTSIGHVRRHV